MSTIERVFGRVRASGPLWIGGVVSLVLFLLAIQLLGATTEAAAAPLKQFFGRYVADDASALGFSWMATYALTNGSVVAALAVSLFDTGIITASQLFLMLAGSRLGAAAIVVLIGALDYFQKQRYSLGEATSLGLLTFLLTHSVYLPATVLGYILLPWLRNILGTARGQFEFSVTPLEILNPVMATVVDAVGAAPGFVLAIGVLFLSLTLFDRVLGRVDTTWLRQRFFRRFRRKWVSFGLGVLVTGVTTSVAFSLGVIVPLYNRQYLKRREVVPYVLGANIGTFFDTVVVAVILESPDGLTLVLVLLALGLSFTLGILLWFAPYFRAVEAVQTRLVENPRYLAGFLVSLVAVPIALTFLPF